MDENEFSDDDIPFFEPEDEDDPVPPNAGSSE